MGSGPRWTQADDDLLADMTRRGYSEKAVSRTLNRSIYALQARKTLLRSLGDLPPAEIGRPRVKGGAPSPTAPPSPHRPRRAGKSTRPCMCCTDPFASEGSHNRMCWECLNKSRSISPYAIA